MNPLSSWLKQPFIKKISNKNLIQVYRKTFIKQYSSQYWLWLLLGIIVPLNAYGVTCDSYGVDTAVNSSGRTYSKCICFRTGGSIHGVSSIWNFIDPRRGEIRGLRAESVHECSDEFDSVCDPSFGKVEFPNEDSTIYLKTSLDPNDYYKCDWIVGVGFSNARKHIPSSPTPLSSSSDSSPPQPINATALSSNWIVSGLLGLFIFLGVLGHYRYRSK